MSLHTVVIAIATPTLSAVANQARSCVRAHNALPVSQFFGHSKLHLSRAPLPSNLRSGLVTSTKAMDSLLSKLGFRPRAAAQVDPSAAANAQGPDDDVPAAGSQFACFGAGCFWGVELAFQRVPGVTKTEVGYTQGLTDMPKYEEVCSGNTGHSEVVRVQFNPAECSYGNLLDAFWRQHDPTTSNRQGGDVGTQYRSGIYYYSPEQEATAKESMERHQKALNRKIVTEILAAKKFYRAESYHQQYLAKGGRFGARQSSEKGCNDPIRCYG